MFNKITSQSIRHTLNNIKKGIHSAYNHVKTIGSHIHTGVHTAAQIYNAVAPVIKEYAPHHANELHHNVSNLASGYNNLRNKVLEANMHATTVGHKLSGII
jgi:leucyl-tRNA synthetase